MSEEDAIAAAAPNAGAGRRKRWIRAALVLIALALFGGVFALGWVLRPGMRLSAVTYGKGRLFTINAHLADAPEGYVFLAGDSYMELYAPEALPCGREIVNGGIGGTKAEDYLRFLENGIRLERPPSAVLLSVGLNHLLRKDDPGTAASRDAFRSTTDALIRRLGETGARIVVIAVPPGTAGMAKGFDLDAIETYTQILREVCAARGCMVRDVFTDARQGDLGTSFGLAKPGLSEDGLHLAHLRRYYRTLYGELCR